MAGPGRVAMPGMGGGMGDMMGDKPPPAAPPDEPEIDPEIEDAAIEAFPDMEGDPGRIAALERLIRAASKPKGLGIMIGIGKEKGKGK